MRKKSIQTKLAGCLKTPLVALVSDHIMLGCFCVFARVCVCGFFFDEADFAACLLLLLCFFLKTCFLRLASARWRKRE